jgi:WD40 repeat protein
MSDEAKPAAAPTAKELKTFPCDRQLLSARFSPCGKFLASGAMDRVVMRWSVAEGDLTPLSPLHGANGWVQSIAFHPSENLLFASDSWGRLACTPYDGDALAVRWEHPAAHDGVIRRVVVSANGKRVATCGADRFVRIWNAADGKPVAQHQHSSDVFVLTFAPDNSLVVFGDLYGKLFALDFAAGKVVREFDAVLFYKLARLQDVAGLRTLTFLDEGRTLAAGGCQPDNGGFLEGAPLLLQFEFESGKLLREARFGSSKDGFIHDMAWHPKGFLMAVTSGQPGAGKLLFLRPDEKEPFFTSTAMANCHALALHPDNRRFIVTSTNRDSNGNGRLLAKDGSYPANTSPVHLFEIG